jgi:phenylalanyl-tRNA synthetase beta chain
LKDAGISVPVVAFELFMPETLFEKIATGKASSLTLSNLQPLKRDFCFVFDNNVRADKLVKVVAGVDRLIESAQVFDVFEGSELGKGKKSVALQITIQPVEKTLNDEDLASLSKRIISAVEQNLHGELR